jgi:signal transduction histidine kinase
LERDLHDGVQNELVSLLLKLRLAEEDPSTPQTLAETFATLADHATAALHSLREITHGIYPRRLERFGVRSALLARAERAAVEVTVEGSAPRSTQKAEEAIYFACSEAIQNSAKHAGRGASVTLRMQHRDDWLAVRIADDGDGFDPLRTPSGAGLENIRDRADDLDGSFTVTSRRGYGTELMIALPWPPRAGRQR